MRRVGYIIEEIVEPSNMEASFRQVLRGSKRKRSRQGCYLLAHKPEVLEELVAQIASGTFRVKDYREREIIEGGKLRRIQVIPMKDRIAVHAIMAGGGGAHGVGHYIPTSPNTSGLCASR
jgi:hypothetical protein